MKLGTGFFDLFFDDHSSGPSKPKSGPAVPTSVLDL